MKCRARRSRYGKRGLDRHDDDLHAVPIGDGVWFAYRAGRALGYGTFVGAEWRPLS